MTTQSITLSPSEIKIVANAFWVRLYHLGLLQDEARDQWESNCLDVDTDADAIEFGKDVDYMAKFVNEHKLTGSTFQFRTNFEERAKLAVQAYHEKNGGPLRPM